MLSFSILFSLTEPFSSVPLSLHVYEMLMSLIPERHTFHWYPGDPLPSDKKRDGI